MNSQVAARTSSLAAKAAVVQFRVQGVVQPPPAQAPGRERRQRQLAATRCGAASKHNSSAAPEVYLGLGPDTDDEGTAFAHTPTALLATAAADMLSLLPGRSAATGFAASLAAAVVLLGLPSPAEALPSVADAVSGVEALVQEAGALGPLVFVCAYVLASVLLVPASLLTLAAGFLFGPVLGTAVVSVASTAGASAAFLVGRYLARPAVEKRIQANARFAAVDAAIGAQGPKIVFLLRLSPLFPFGLLNYALSLTRVEFGPYVLASWAGMIPGTIAYVALGGAGKAAAETAAGGGAGPLQLALYAVGAIATLWATSLISKAASKALEEASVQSADGAGGAGADADASRPLGSRDSE